MKGEDLSRNNIFYYKEPAQDGDLPRHIDSLRTALLDFTCTISERLGFETDDDIRAFESRCDAERFTRYDSGYYDMKESLLEYETIRKNADRLYRGGDREAEWQTFFLKNFFAPLADEMQIDNSDSRRYVRL